MREFLVVKSKVHEGIAHIVLFHNGEPQTKLSIRQEKPVTIKEGVYDTTFIGTYFEYKHGDGSHEYKLSDHSSWLYEHHIKQYISCKLRNI